MKKVLSLALILALSLTFSASAAFVSSPSNNQAPELISGENASEDCEARLNITPYSEKDELPEELQELMQEAYDIIKATPDLSALNEKLAEIASSLNVPTDALQVSDLFDIHATDCDVHEDHLHFDITLKSEVLEHFAALLHYYNGEWVIVEGAEVTNNGTHLEFDAKEFSPFAIVVDSTDLAPETGDSARPVLYATVMAVSLALIVLVVYKSKKKA